MAVAAKPAKPKTLRQVLDGAAKKYDLRVGPLSSVTEDVLSLSTGNLAIDHIFGTGGIPLGRSIELYGIQSSGKTTTALQAAAELQRLILTGGDESRGVRAADVMIYFDYEHALDISYCAALGLDVDHPSFLLVQPDFLEQGANLALEAIATGEVRLLIWDSVAAMNPEAAQDAPVGASLPAIQARVMSDFLRKLNPTLHEHNCASVFINHLREKMQIGGFQRPGMPPATTTPGGSALKFYSSVRVEFTQISSAKGTVPDLLTNEDIERVVASNVRVKVTKNKLAPPFKQAVVRVRFGRGFDNFWTALQVLIAHKQIVYSSGYFYFEKVPDLVHEQMPRQATGSHRPYLQGESTVFDFADTYPAWRGAAISAAADVVDQALGALDAITPTGESVTDPEHDVDPSAGTAAELDALLGKDKSVPGRGRVALVEDPSGELVG